MMDRQSKEGGLTEKQLQDFLDKGGKIQKCPAGARTETFHIKVITDVSQKKNRKRNESIMGRKVSS